MKNSSHPGSHLFWPVDLQQAPQVPQNPENYWFLPDMQMFFMFQATQGHLWEFSYSCATILLHHDDKAFVFYSTQLQMLRIFLL